MLPYHRNILEIPELVGLVAQNVQNNKDLLAFSAVNHIFQNAARPHIWHTVKDLNRIAYLFPSLTVLCSKVWGDGDTVIVSL